MENDYEYREDERQHAEIMEEIGEYSENVYRSEEEGWFYSDNDGTEECCDQ
jgi:hypothetical protein